jgi:hypothetical protein
MADPFYNKTVTVWNKSVDGLMETEHWYPTLIENVRILVSKGNNQQTSGLENANSARLHIMDGISAPSKEYLPPADWLKLVQEDKPKYYTLESENDSFFVEGDTTAVDASGKDNFFDYMKRNYGNCFKISAVDRYDSTIAIPHWEVWGK